MLHLPRQLRQACFHYEYRKWDLDESAHALSHPFRAGLVVLHQRTMAVNTSTVCCSAVNRGGVRFVCLDVSRRQARAVAKLPAE